MFELNSAKSREHGQRSLTHWPLGDLNLTDHMSTSTQIYVAMHMSSQGDNVFKDANSPVIHVSVVYTFNFQYHLISPTCNVAQTNSPNKFFCKFADGVSILANPPYGFTAAFTYGTNHENMACLNVKFTSDYLSSSRLMILHEYVLYIRSIFAQTGKCLTSRSKLGSYMMILK